MKSPNLIMGSFVFAITQNAQQVLLPTTNAIAFAGIE